MATVPPWWRLKEDFVAALDGGKDWLDLWRLLVDSSWYQEQLHLMAERFIRRCSQTPTSVDDLKHDVILLLARKLRSRPDMGLNRELAGTCFGGWMATIIRMSCQEALRVARRPQPQPSNVVSDDRAPGRALDLDARLDLSMALDRLPYAVRTVMVLHHQGWPLREIAVELDQTYWTTRRRLREGQRLMAECLRERN